MRSNIFGVLAALAISTAAALAHDFTFGSLRISHPYARATPPGAPASAGYLTIENTGGEVERLIGVEGRFSGKTEIHEMSMDGEVMKMRPVPGGVVIPPGGEVSLEPGGLHIMFMQLGSRLLAGETRKATLVFEKSGRFEVEFAIEDGSVGDSAHQGDGG
jgi:periplasmic copper chaperone A